MIRNTWADSHPTEQFSYLCGFCGKSAAPGKMYVSTNNNNRIYICPNCTQPTFIDVHNDKQTPQPRLGRDVDGISQKDVAGLYQEARDCTSVRAYTATVMVCRKILMNLDVQHKAEENRQFAYYVDYLADKGFVPPQGKKWVTAIKDRGNDANHEIDPMNEKDAQLILHFTEALLRFNYEMPHLFEEDKEKE